MIEYKVLRNVTVPILETNINLQAAEGWSVHTITPLPQLAGAVMVVLEREKNGN